MAEESYSKVSQDLDNLLLKLFELLEKLMEERDELDNLMKEAFVNMAKTRYNLGNQRISSLQLDMKKMLALKNTSANECSGNGYSFVSFSVIDRNTKEDSSEEENTTRKRIVKNENDNEQLKESESKEIKMISLKPKQLSQKIQDPLKWFGVLVPQSLRICQKYFQNSVTKVTTIASIQSEINAIFNKIEQLKEERSRLSKINSEKICN